ncbi:MAG TPA: hypothetical protein PJ990_15470 [Saprospiraceae bacterium]|nr:hypothetical protein [Saprospiraceae bacterium]
MQAQCPPPANDHYTAAASLVLNTQKVGTTCCATGFGDDPETDLPNLACSADFDHNSVWYKYVTGQEDWISVNFYIISNNE